MIEIKKCPVCLNNNLQILGCVNCAFDANFSTFPNAELNHVLKTLSKDEVEVQTVHCENCDHLFLSPSFDKDEIPRLYSDSAQKQIGEYYKLVAASLGKSYSEYVGTADFEQKRKISIDTRPKIIKAMLKKYAKVDSGKIVDWGGGSGVNIAMMRGSFDLFVMDLGSNERIEGIKYFNDPKGLSEFRPFDVVVTTHTLEHVVDLSSEVENMVNLIRVGSIIYVEVPCQSARTIIFKKPMALHWHVNYFTRNSLKNLFAIKGFKCRHFSLRMMPYNEIRALTYLAVFEYIGERRPLDKNSSLALFQDVLTMALKKGIYLVWGKEGL